MTHDGETLSRVRGVLLQNLTTTDLDAVLGSSSLAPGVVSQLEQGILAADAMSAQRAYCFGLPIPEAGSIVSVSVDAGSSSNIRPEGSELWQVTGMEGTGVLGSATIDIMWFDETQTVLMVSQKTLAVTGTMIDLNEKVSSPFILSNSLFLVVANSAINAAEIKIAYHVVSL